MTINDEGKQLRAEVAKLRPDKRRRYSPELRQRILGWVDRAVAEGAMYSECGKALGIKTWRFVTWRRACDPPAKSERASLAMVPIESPLLPMPPVVSVITPAGFRVTGLRFDQLVGLLREFG